MDDTDWMTGKRRLTWKVSLLLGHNLSEDIICLLFVYGMSMRTNKVHDLKLLKLSIFSRSIFYLGLWVYS